MVQVEQTSKSGEDKDRSAMSRRSFLSLMRKLLQSLAVGRLSTSLPIESLSTMKLEPPMGVDYPPIPDTEFRFDPELVEFFHQEFGQFFQLVTERGQLSEEMWERIEQEGNYIVERPSAIQVKYLYCFLTFLRERTRSFDMLKSDSSHPRPIIFLNGHSFWYFGSTGTRYPTGQFIRGEEHTADCSHGHFPDVILLKASQSAVAELDYVIPHEFAHLLDLQDVQDAQRARWMDEITQIVSLNQSLTPDLDPNLIGQNKYALFELSGLFGITKSCSPARLLQLFMLLTPIRNFSDDKFYADEASLNWGITEPYNQLFLEQQTDSFSRSYGNPDDVTMSLTYAGTNQTELVAELSQLVARQGLLGFRDNYYPRLLKAIRSWAPAIIKYYDSMTDTRQLSYTYGRDPIGIYLWQSLKDLSDNDWLQKTEQLTTEFSERIVQLILTHIWHVDEEYWPHVFQHGLLPELDFTELPGLNDRDGRTLSPGQQAGVIELNALFAQLRQRKE